MFQVRYWKNLSNYTLVYIFLLEIWK